MGCAGKCYTQQTREWTEAAEAKEKIVEAFKEPTLEVSVKEKREEMKPQLCPDHTFYKAKISGWVVTVKGSTLVEDELEKWAKDHFSTKTLAQSLLAPTKKKGLLSARPKFQVTSDPKKSLMAKCRTIAGVEGFCGAGKVYDDEKADSFCASSPCSKD